LDRDVAIIGGGLAGLTLALQLGRANPALKIAVVERNRHPCREAAFKVGESTAELGASYLRDFLKLEDHLNGQELIKLGLRFFFSADGNRDLGRRVEFGLSTHLSSRTYQLDRGRLENELARRVAAEGAEFIDGTRVVDWSGALDGHRLELEDDRGARRSLTARWVADASGRPGLIKRRLGLEEPAGHAGSASWWRVEGNIELEEFSADHAWRLRVKDGWRRLSTNHLMGPGYWFWLIPLASDCTSLGIVVDPSLHRFDEINTLDRSIDWLARHEPQAAELMEDRRDRVLDFRVLRDYPKGCKRVFSPDRWCMTGESGVFLDPFYSPGTDFIALANTLITDLVVRDFNGERKLNDRIERYNRWFLTTFMAARVLFAEQYSVMGSARAMAAKGIWDFIRYWGSIAMLGMNRGQVDLEVTTGTASDFHRLNVLDRNMQRFLREWAALDATRPEDTFIDYGTFPVVTQLNAALVKPRAGGELVDAIESNVQVAERVASTIMARAFRATGITPRQEPLDPFTALLSEGLPGRWDRAGDEELDSMLSSLWLDDGVLRQPAPV